MFQFDDEIIKRTITEYGIRPQMNQTQEECAELIVEINKYLNRRGHVKKLISEIADVIIMTRCLSFIFDKESIQAEIDFKLNRLRGRMENDKTNNDGGVTSVG